MKAILMSIKPNWVKEILNGNKTIEVRKRFPSDYVGWVYIYCTKGGDMICYRPNFDGYACVPNLYGNEHFNGKVVARFWCDKVEEQPANRPIEEYVFEKGCLTSYDILDYCGYKTFYAIHITKLEIFDSPKEISEFSYKNCKTCIANDGNCYLKNECQGLPLTRAPQSWCYIEI